VLARGQDFYGIWDASSPNGAVLERFPPTAAGWYAARRRVDSLKHGEGDPDTSPIISPRTNRGALVAAGIVLLGVVLGVAGLFPAYLGGENLVSESAQLLPHVAYISGWALVAALLLIDRRLARGAAGLGVGVGLISFGFFLTDVLTAGALHAQSPGAGLYLSLAGWLAGSAGSVTALCALGSPNPRGSASAWRHPLVLTGAIAALGAAVAFALPWDSYTLTAATTGSSQTTTAGNVFANPGAIITGNVVTMALIVIVVAVAIAWRPTLVGVTVLAGALVPLGAQVFATLAQPVPPLSEFGVSAAQASAGQVSLTGSYTGWFYLYCAFVASLVVLTGWIASNTSSEVAS
jgi:MFS family permease